MNDPSALLRSARKMGSISSVALVGFMGAGKTTVGKALASRLQWRFVDLDLVIERQEGTTIEKIFRSRGEAAFRELERSMIQRLIDAGPQSTVIALGGGAFASIQVQGMLNSAAIASVHLEAPADELYRRSEQPEVRRPLRQNLDQFCALYQSRSPAYKAATITISTAGRNVSEIVEEIVSRLSLQPASGVAF
jgi:shikimate kinase